MKDVLIISFLTSGFFFLFRMNTLELQKRSFIYRVSNFQAFSTTGVKLRVALMRYTGIPSMLGNLEMWLYVSLTVHIFVPLKYNSLEFYLLFPPPGTDHYHVYLGQSQWVGGTGLPLCSQDPHPPVPATEECQYTQGEHHPLQCKHWPRLQFFSRYHPRYSKTRETETNIK